MNVARSFAPLLAVAIIESVGNSWCFAMNAICFIPMIHIMAAVRIPNATTQQEKRRKHRDDFSTTFAKYQVLKEVLPQVACLSILVMPSVALLPAISLKGSELVSFWFYVFRFGVWSGCCCRAYAEKQAESLITSPLSGWAGGLRIGLPYFPALESLGSEWICALAAGAALTFSLAAANNAVQRKAPNIYRGRFSPCT